MSDNFFSKTNDTMLNKKNYKVFKYGIEQIYFVSQSYEKCTCLKVQEKINMGTNFRNHFLKIETKVLHESEV